MNRPTPVRFSCILLFAAASLLPGCRAAEENVAGNTLKSLGGEAIPVRKMEATVEQLLKKAGVAGLSCAVINDAKIVYVKAFGYRNKKQETRNDEETIFSAASFSKTVFAYLMLKLAEAGKIDLDRPLGEYLSRPLDEYPKYADLKGDDRSMKITARIVLSHQTGFPNWRFLTEDGKLLFLFDPGARYSYSGEGIALLQMVVEEITGRGLEDLAREMVFEPLGMTRTSYVWRDEFDKNYAWPHDEFERPRMKERRSGAEAAGSMQTTAQDYARLLEDILQAKNLSRASAEKMLTPQVAITSERMFGPGNLRETEANSDIRLSWCLGWGRFDSEHGRAFFHTGHEFGFQNYTVTYADAGIGVVLLSNSDNFESVAREIVAAVIGPEESPFDWLGYPRFDPAAKKVAPPEPKAIQVDAKILEDYVGDYEIQPGRIFSVKLADGHLFISSEKDKWTEILPESETRFFVKDSDYVFTFKKDQGGSVTGFVLSLREIEIEGKKLTVGAANLPQAQEPPALLPDAPQSDARWVPIERFKKEAPPLASSYEARIYRSADGEVIPYRLFRPKVEPGSRYPLVLFLHGSSGSGTDNEKQLDRANWFGGLVWALPENQTRHPCFVVAPQSNENWPAVRLIEGQLPEILPGPGRARLAIEIVERLIDEFPIDQARIYVTGHSMGGAGTWHVLAQRPDLFAAGVPVCGRADLATLPRLKDIPIWCFHGEKDEIEPVESSRQAVEALRKAGGRPLYTEYPDVEHNVFMWVYTEPALIEWLFAQHR